MAQEDYTKRSGKYRHVYGDPAKPDKQFLEIKKPLTSGEGSYVKANARFFAVSKSSGGGPVYIHRLDKPGRFPANEPTLDVHKGKVWDMDFHPFIDNMIATASDDCRVNVSQFPKDGLTEDQKEAAVTLEGHAKKVALCQWHPSAMSILASGSFDRSVKVWNVETSACVATYNKLGDNIYSLEWNKDGSQLACTGKDKKLRILDPRNLDDDSIGIVDAFDGAKSSKCFWVPRLNWIGAVGFSKQAKRQLKLWDLRNLGKAIYSNVIDQAASVLVPKFDDDNGLLYLAGKGDGSINFSEIIGDDRKVYALGSYRNPEPQKGGGWVPKRGLDVWKCEVQRFLKLTQKSVIPISFIVPRKAGADVFQEDIYPDAVSSKPALSADEWLNGENKDPCRMALDPAKRSDDDGGVQFVAKKTYAELEAENEALKARIAELEAKLGIKSDDDEKKEDDDANANNNADAAAAADDNNGNDDAAADGA